MSGRNRAAPRPQRLLISWLALLALPTQGTCLARAGAAGPEWHSGTQRPLGAWLLRLRHVMASPRWLSPHSAKEVWNELFIARCSSTLQLAAGILPSCLVPIFGDEDADERAQCATGVLGLSDDDHGVGDPVQARRRFLVGDATHPGSSSSVPHGSNIWPSSAQLLDVGTVVNFASSQPNHRVSNTSFAVRQSTGRENVLAGAIPNIGQGPCTLMDALLTLRHYHPLAGRSGWAQLPSLVDTAPLVLPSLHDNTLLSSPRSQCTYTTFKKPSSPDMVAAPLGRHSDATLVERNPPSLDLTGRTGGYSIMGPSIEAAANRLPPHQVLGLVGLLVLGMATGAAGATVAAVRFAAGCRRGSRALHLRSKPMEEVVPGPPSTRDHAACGAPVATSRSKRDTGALAFLDGFRVISIAWVVLGHSMLYWSTFLPFDEVTAAAPAVFRDPLNYPFVAAVFAVDTFFFLSGFLSAIHLLPRFVRVALLETRSRLRGQVAPIVTKETADVAAPRTATPRREERHAAAGLCSCLNGCAATTPKAEGASWSEAPNGVNAVAASAATRRYSSLSKSLIYSWRCLQLSAILVFRRYLRLMFITSVVLFGYLALNFERMKLPIGSRYLAATNISCSEFVVELLTLTSNVSRKEYINECFGWSWYLANDFQFYLLGLPLMALAAWTPRVFGFVWSILMIWSHILAFNTAKNYGLGLSINRLTMSWRMAGLGLPGRKQFPLHPLMDYFYVKPWIRVTPYLLGLGLGTIITLSGTDLGSPHSRAVPVEDFRYHGPDQLTPSTINNIQIDSHARCSRYSASTTTKNPSLDPLSRATGTNEDPSTERRFGAGILRWSRQHPHLVGLCVLGSCVVLIGYGHLCCQFPNPFWNPLLDWIYMSSFRTLWGFGVAGSALLLLNVASKKRDELMLLRNRHGDILSKVPVQNIGASNRSSWSSITVKFQSRLSHIGSLVDSCASLVSWQAWKFWSHPIWSYLSPLVFCSYLIHPIIIFFYYGNGFGPVEFERGPIILGYSICLAVTIAVALPLHFVVEKPLNSMFFSSWAV